jgi:hypothetical protein
MDILYVDDVVRDSVDLLPIVRVALYVEERTQ